MDRVEDGYCVGGKHHSEQDDEETVTRLDEFKKSIERKLALRQSNLNPERPDKRFLRTLNSSVKRNTAVIKKLKQINEEQHEVMMQELRGVNLSKFVSEAVAAICDAKLRTSDIHAAIQDGVKIETKIRNIRFIGELCKFRVASPGFVFGCLKACFDDFTRHNIDVACSLLETCGRFLYRSPETTKRMTHMLEILMRFKNVKNLDPHQNTLIENVYYLCKPPERYGRVSKMRPPLHQYVRKLLFTDLNKSSMEHVLRQLCKLPWSECESYLLKCFMKIHRGNYSQVDLIAALTVGLSCHHDEFAVAVVDEVLEEIRLGLELNDYGFQQRRITHMRFLGELYNYEHISSSVIFETLYLILNFGNGTPEQDVLDPPEDCFRIRMVITLLQTCGHYFDRGSSKKKLDRFFIYFQWYILSKGSISLDVEFDLQDLFDDIRPNLTRYSSIDEVAVVLTEIEEHDMLADLGFVENELGSQSAQVERHNDEHYLYKDKLETRNDECQGNHGQPVASSEYSRVLVTGKMVEVDLQEEIDFERELKALMQESLVSRKLELQVKPTLNMMVPIKAFEEPAKSHHGNDSGKTVDKALDEEGGGWNGEVCVKVLVNRRNKRQTKQMLIPQDSLLVQSTKQNEAAELEERREIKKLVLQYNERQEEEQLIEVQTQLLNWIQTGSGSTCEETGGSGMQTGHDSTYEETGGRAYGVHNRHQSYVSSASGIHHRRQGYISGTSAMNCRQHGYLPSSGRLYNGRRR